MFDEKNLIKKIENIIKKKDGIKRKQDKNFNDYFCNLKNELASDNIVRE